MRDSSIKTEVKTINPALAEELLKNNVFNRTVHKKTVNFYASQMRRGQWELNGEPIIIAKSGRVLDGQHRLYAVIESNTTIKTLMIYGVEDRTFDTINQGKPRSGGDVLSIAGVPNARRASSIISVYNRMKTRSEVLIKGSNHDKELGFSKRDILNMYKSNPIFWENITKLSSTLYSTKRLFSLSEMGGTMAYLILEKNHPEEKIFSFFKQLVGDEEVRNNTINLLSDRIVNASLRGMKIESKHKTALLIKTFNAYLVGREYKSLYYNESTEDYPTYL